MLLRLNAVLVVAVLTLAACGSGDEDVPSDQVVKPTSAPSDWTENDLGTLTIAAPSEWTKDGPTNPSDTITMTTWRATDGTDGATAGMQVKVISSPQQDAEKAAQAQAVDAQAKLDAGDVRPEKVVWPDAEKAYYLSYPATTATTGDPVTYETRTLILDLADGQQVQVTALGDKSSPVDPDTVLGTVVLTPETDA